MTDERLFVPLKTEHWENFKDGSKTWELRGTNDRFTEDTVWEGRRVELRRGYSTGDSLWGEVSDVKTFEDLAVVAEVVGQEKITPGATEAEFVEQADDLLGDYEEYIAFKVDLFPAPGDDGFYEHPEHGGMEWYTYEAEYRDITVTGWRCERCHVIGQPEEVKEVFDSHDCDHYAEVLEMIGYGGGEGEEE